MAADAEQRRQAKQHRRWAWAGRRQGERWMLPRQTCMRQMTDVGLVDVHVEVCSGHQDDCPIYQH